jgi:tetratricopeptide (TPR) repeat protein
MEAGTLSPVEASRCGSEPQPGLALLRLAQGEVEAATAAIRRALGETTQPLKRAGLLPAHVEIMLAAGEPERAHGPCREPEEIAERQPSDILGAIAAHRRGATTLAEGDAANALPTLRHALEAWRELPAPYDVARVRLLIGSACRILGDEDTATLELKAAREVFAELGAASALAAINSIAGRTADVDLLGSRRGRRRCCAWSPQAGATARSPPSW